MHNKMSFSGFRFWVFALLILLAPLSKYPYVGLPAFNFTSFRIGLYQILLIIFILSCVKPTAIYINSFWRKNKLVSLSALTLLAVILVGLFNAYNLNRSLLLAGSVLMLIIGFVCTWWYTANKLAKKDVLKLVNLLMWAAVLYGVVAILQFIFASLASETFGILCKNCTSAVFGFPRINGLSAEPQFFANAMLPFLFVSLAYYYKYKTRLSLLALILSTLTIGLTFSRGAYFALTVGLIAFTLFIFVTKKSIKNLMFGVIFIFAAGLISLILLVGSASYKYQDTPNITYNTVKSTLAHLSQGFINLPDKQITVINQSNNNANDDFVSPGLIEESANERLSAADLAIKAWQYNNLTFLIGTGAGNLGPFVVNNINATAPNNLTVYIQYILVLGELGITGLLAFFGILFGSLYSVVKLIKSKNSLLFITLASILIAFLVQYLFFGSYINVIYIWIWFGLAIGVSNSKLAKNIL